MIDPFFLFGYALLGVFAGLLAGLLGTGGGLIIVPSLIALFTLQGLEVSIIAHAAVGTSLATIVATSISSTISHHKFKAIQWVIVFRLALGLVIGGFTGAWIADQLNTSWLQFVFGLFAIIVSLIMFFKIHAIATKELPGSIGMNVVGFLIGAVSGVVGIGGGSMTVPFLSAHNISIQKAVATSSACGLPIAVAGFIGFVITGWSGALMPDHSMGYVYFPAFLMISFFSVIFAPIGAKLAHKLPVLYLKRIFALLLFLLGLKMIS